MSGGFKQYNGIIWTILWNNIIHKISGIFIDRKHHFYYEIRDVIGLWPSMLILLMIHINEINHKAYTNNTNHKAYEHGHSFTQ